MLDNVDDIAAYYNSNPEQEHTRLERHQLEYDLTCRYLNQYLPRAGKILEVGAATGWYTLELARRRCALTAVDLSAQLLEKCRQRIAAVGLASQVRFVTADARDLRAVTEKEFDAALLMGPLYHLIREPDRQLALREVFGRLKPGGLIFSAFISRLGIFGDLLKNMPEWIENQAEVRSLMERGRDPKDFPHGGFRGYFARVSELAPLHEAAGFKTLVVGASRHLLYIGQK